MDTQSLLDVLDKCRSDGFARPADNHPTLLKHGLAVPANMGIRHHVL